MKKIDSELEQVSKVSHAPAVEQFPTPTKEVLLGWIRSVDLQVEKPSKRTSLELRIDEYGLVYIGYGLIIGALLLSLGFVLYGKPISLDTLLLGVTLVAVIVTIGVTLAFTGDQWARVRKVAGRKHVKVLIKKNTKASPLLLGALVRMRISLPPEATLEEAYVRDNDSFTMQKLVHRALDAKLS